MKLPALFGLSLLLASSLPLTGCQGPKTSSSRVPLEDAVVAFTAPKTTELGVIWAEEAAKDVAMALSKITGKNVPVVAEGQVPAGSKTVVYVGDTAAAKADGIDTRSLRDVESALRAKDGKVFIAARTGMGVNNGCMEFLQRYCDFWFVSVWGDGESFARNPSLAVPEFDFILKPAFTCVHVYGGNLRPADRKGYWAKVNRSPAWFAKRYPFERRCRTWYLNDEADAVNRVSTKCKTSHSQFDYLPPEKYFKDHPEWYSMDEKGLRRAVPNNNSQICFTNPEAREEIWKNMRAKILEDRAERPTDYPHIYTFVQMDQCHHLCLCPECKKITARGGDTALQLHLVNELARRLQREFPDVTLRISAYVSTGEIAKDGTRPEPNVMVKLCDLYTKCDHERPLGEKPINDGMKKILDDWFAQTPNLEVWDYMIAGPKYFIEYPEVNIKALAHDSKYFRDNGIRRFSIEHECSSEPCWDLNQFLIGQFYFNPDADGNVLMDKYCRMFGPAQNEMRAAFDFLVKRMDECGGVPASAWWPKKVAFRNRGTWEPFLAHLEKAYPLAPEGSPKGIVAHLIVETARELFGDYKMSADRASELARLKKAVPEHLGEMLKTRLSVNDSDKRAYQDAIESVVALLDIDFSDKPACFQGLSASDVIALEYHMTDARCRRELVDDPKSTVGKVFRMPASNGVVTVSCGVNDPSAHKSLQSFSFSLAKGEDDYRWCRLGETPITRTAMLWLTRRWIPNFDLGKYWHTCDGIADDNRFEVWVSARRNTPANELYIDRVLLRRVTGDASAECPPSVRYAQEEFSRYVRQMTGRDYDGAVEIALDAALGDDAFAVTKRNGKLTIRGGRRGVLYGVYDVLEKFGGVKWLSSWCERVPKAGRFTVPEGTDYSEKPAFWARLPYWHDILQHPDFAARLRVNGYLSKPLQEKHGGSAYHVDRKFGFSHTFNKLVPPEEFGKTHPEYFSEINGKRVTEKTQLCLTNPDVFKIVVQRIREAIAENPEADMYALAHNDYKNWCECPNCKAINDAADNPGMTEFVFVNKVVEEIAKDHPDIIFKLSAYVYTRKPPPADFKCHPNVMVDLCPIEADLIFPLPESKWKDSIDFCKDMDGWSKVRGKNFLIWDYNTAFLNFPQILPNALTPQGNYRYYLSKGVNMIFSQGGYTGYHAEFAELKAYLQAKWAWNPDLPAEQLLKDFFEGYYGPAAPFVREYFDDIYARQRAYCADGKHYMSCYSPAKSLAVDAAFFKQSAELWDKARAAVKGDPMFEYNVKMSAFAFEFTSLCLNAKRYYLTERPERFGPETDAVRLAKNCVAAMDEAKRKRGGRIRLMEGAPRENLRIAGLVDLSKSDPVDKSVKTSLIVPAKDFGRTRDFALTNGVARFDRKKYGWVTALYLGNLAYDEGVTYRLRMHAKVERSADMPDGIAFKGGYHDKENNVNIERAVKASEASSDWQWYDIGETTFCPKAQFWISSGTFDQEKFKENPCLDAVLIDKVEIMRTDSNAP